MTPEKRQNIVTAIISAVALLVMVLFGGCRPTQSIEKTHTVELRDTIIITEPDSAIVQSLIECDSLGNLLIQEIYTLQSQKAQAGTVYKYITPQQLNLKTRFITLHDTIRVPTYKERISEIKTIHPKETDNYYFAWFILGAIFGCFITFKILR